MKTYTNSSKANIKPYSNLSKTKIKFRSKKKTNPIVVETLNLAKANKSWLEVAKLIAGSRRGYQKINLSEIDLVAKDGDVVVVIGKLLSGGDITKKIKLRAMAYSESAEAKLKKSKVDYALVSHEIKNNKEAKGVKVFK